MRFLKNKYFITVAAFIVYILFFDHNNIFLQIERKKQLNSLVAGRKFYEQQIAETRKNLQDLQTNSAALEKYAREKFLLKRDNEDLFVVQNSLQQKQ